MRWIVSTLMLLSLFALAQQAQPPKLIDKPDKMDKPAAAMLSTPRTEVDGENLEQWMAKLKSPDASARDAAIRVLPAFGPPAEKAVPILLSMMIEDRDISVRTSALLVLTSYPIAKDDKLHQTLIKNLNTLMLSTQNITRLQAVTAAGRLGTNGAGCIKSLCDLLETSRESSYEVRHRAAASLAAVAFGANTNGPDVRAIHSLLQAMSDSALVVRGEAVQSLMILGRPASDTEWNNEKQWVVRRIESERDLAQKMWLRVCLMRLDPATIKTHMPLIVKEMTNLKLRVVAAEAIGMLGKGAKPQLSDLRKGVNSEDKSDNLAFIAMCMWALAQMQGDALPALEDIRKWKTHKDDGIKAYANYAEQMITGKRP